jgi:hypothetical protein
MPAERSGQAGKAAPRMVRLSFVLDLLLLLLLLSFQIIQTLRWAIVVWNQWFREIEAVAGFRLQVAPAVLGWKQSNCTRVLFAAQREPYFRPLRQKGVDHAF